MRLLLNGVESTTRDISIACGDRIVDAHVKALIKVRPKSGEFTREFACQLRGSWHVLINSDYLSYMVLEKFASQVLEIERWGVGPIIVYLIEGVMYDECDVDVEIREVQL